MPNLCAGEPGNPHKDGGMVDRVGLNGWRALLAAQQLQQGRVRPSIVHLIARSSRFSGTDDAGAVCESLCWCVLTLSC